jgi:hypothetical protein
MPHDGSIYYDGMKTGSGGLQAFPSDFHNSRTIIDTVGFGGRSRTNIDRFPYVPEF